MTRLDTFPKYFRGEPAPKLVDSAFPPLKTEHRYRGVYERAGFEVNLGGSGADASLVRSPPLRMPRRAPQASQASSPVSPPPRGVRPPPAASHAASSASLASLGERSRAASQTSLPRRAPRAPPQAPTNPYVPLNVAPAPYLPYSRAAPGPQTGVPARLHPSPPASANLVSLGRYHNADFAAHSAASSGAASSSAGPASGSVGPASGSSSVSAGSAHSVGLSRHASSIHSEFDFSPRPPHEAFYPSKNVKNLLLKLESSNLTHADEIDTHSVHSQNMFDGLDDSTQDTSVSASRLYERSGLPDLVGAVVELAKEALPVVALPPYPISRDVSLVKKQRLLSALNQFKLDVEDVKKHTPELKGAQQFDDYEDFLHIDRQQPRHSQMSMVSSILSKESQNDEDAEIERELERQLQLLKTGEQAPAPEVVLSSLSRTPLLPPPILQVPTFKIDPEPALSSETQSPPCAQPQPQPQHAVMASPPDSPPVRVRPEMTNPPTAFDPRKRERRRRASVEAADDVALALPVSTTASSPSPGSFESIRGLSIKHTYSEGGDLTATATPLAAAPAALPCAPGQGPCRTCHQPILPHSKGAQKAIFSKTGELSGQWHRGCFECLHGGCAVHFHKGVQCYAFNDQPYCHSHYHELNGTLCQRCNGGIEGECIENELSHKWHLQCLTCHHCGRGIREDYYVINGQVHCEADALERMAAGARQDKIQKRRTRLMFVD